jgi:hypothetical protein
MNENKSFCAFCDRANHYVLFLIIWCRANHGSLFGPVAAAVHSTPLRSEFRSAIVRRRAALKSIHFR